MGKVARYKEKCTVANTLDKLIHPCNIITYQFSVGSRCHSHCDMYCITFWWAYFWSKLACTETFTQTRVGVISIEYGNYTQSLFAASCNAPTSAPGTRIRNGPSVFLRKKAFSPSRLVTAGLP